MAKLPALVAVALVVLVIVVLYQSNMPYDLSNTGWDGYSRAAKVCGIRPIYRLGELKSINELFVIPLYKIPPSVLEGIRLFVANGGTLVLLSNGAMYGNSVLKDLGTGLVLSSGPVEDPVFNVVNQYFPLASTLNTTLTPLGLVIALDNASAVFNVTRVNVTYIASTSPVSTLNGGPGPFFVIAEERVGKGSIIVISTPSVFMNSMIGLDDNMRLLKLICANKTVGMFMPTIYSGNPRGLVRLYLVLAYSYVSSYPINYTLVMVPALVTLWYMVKHKNVEH